MGSAQSAFNISNQASINNVYQNTSSVCNASCSNKITNSNIVVSDGARTGNITYDLSCTAEALCTLRSQLKTIAAQQLKSEQMGADGTSCWGLFCVGVSVNVSNQVMENSTTQIITNTCSATSNNLISDVNVDVTSGGMVGNITFDQTGSAVAQCSIESASSASINQSASSSQSATSGFDTVLLIVIAIVVVIVLLGTAFFRYETVKSQTQLKISEQKALTQAIIANRKAKESLASAGTITDVTPTVSSVQSSVQPSVQSSVQPSAQPSVQPSVQPSTQPSVQPSVQPSTKTILATGVANALVSRASRTTSTRTPNQTKSSKPVTKSKKSTKSQKSKKSTK